MIDRAGSAGFVHNDLGQLRQRGLHLLVNPLCQAFAGGVLQPWNIVQIVVVEQIEQRLEGPLHIGKIHHPAFRLLNLSADMDLDPERVSVQARAFVAGRKIRQAMR